MPNSPRRTKASLHQVWTGYLAGYADGISLKTPRVPKAGWDSTFDSPSRRAALLRAQAAFLVAGYDPRARRGESMGAPEQ